ncbi:MAG: nitroreductase family deazaflavin-dependent oxidoreductase [Anaerolineales bacterium]|nr:nitroreductase family deazaflavin-dependent oxidoreductase [Anaerolineales bacterium]
MKQKTLDRIRVLNKRFTNKLLIHIAGKKATTFGVLGHTGRKSGRLYRIPIIARPYENGFVIAMTYGKKVDWYENVKASGRCTLFWKGKEYSLIYPELISPEHGVTAFPKLLQGMLRNLGIEYFLKLEIQS